MLPEREEFKDQLSHVILFHQFSMAHESLLMRNRNAVSILQIVSFLFDWPPDVTAEAFVAYTESPRGLREARQHKRADAKRSART